MVKDENPETVIGEMFQAVRDFFAALGAFTVIMATIGYAWGYFA